MLNSIQSRCTIVAIALIALGCQDDPLAKVRVHGIVTFDGGPCPAAGRVTFSPIEVANGAPRRPAAGVFETDGAYEAMSFRPGDGLIPGKYLVGVACFDPAKLSGAPSDQEFMAASYVADDFQPAELIVEPGSGPIEFNFDVPRR